MKRLLLVLMVGMLAGCAPMVWTKPGATNEDFNQDKYKCHAVALRSAPKTLINTNCNQWTGTCQVQDVNAAEREQLFKECMVSKGWTWQKQNQQ